MQEENDDEISETCNIDHLSIGMPIGRFEKSQIEIPHIFCNSNLNSGSGLSKKNLLYLTLISYFYILY